MKTLLSAGLCSLAFLGATAAENSTRALTVVNYRGEELPVFALPRPLQPRHTVAPRYPARELAGATDGSAVVTMLVDTRGRVAEVDVLTSEPTAAFGEAAREAVRHWRFEPQAKDGHPTKFIVQETIQFRAPSARAKASTGPSLDLTGTRFPYYEGFHRFP